MAFSSSRGTANRSEGLGQDGRRFRRPQRAREAGRRAAAVPPLTIIPPGATRKRWVSEGQGVKLGARGPRAPRAPRGPYRVLAGVLGLGSPPRVTAEEVGRILADRVLWPPLGGGWMMAGGGAGLPPRQYDLLAILAARPG